MSQKEAVDTISDIYKLRKVVRKQKDERTKKDIQKVELILADYTNDELREGIEVVKEFGS
jgi:hypothetical protein